MLIHTEVLSSYYRLNPPGGPVVGVHDGKIFLWLSYLTERYDQAVLWNEQLAGKKLMDLRQPVSCTWVTPGNKKSCCKKDSSMKLGNTYVALFVYDE